MAGLQRLTSPGAAAAPGAGVPGPERVSGPSAVPEGYKWIALFISTLGMLMATIDSSIVLIALPDVFRGIGNQDEAQMVVATRIGAAQAVARQIAAAELPADPRSEEHNV